MKKLNILDIRIDGGTQVRESLNQDKVNEYASLMKDGIVFPPITVFHDGKDNWLAAGFHRYFAYQQNNNVALDCDVRMGEIDDAILFALASNQHGIPHTPEDNQKAIGIMVSHPVWGLWSNRQIAKHIGVSEKTIRNFRTKEDIPQKEEVLYSRKGTDHVQKKGKKVDEKKPAAENHVENDVLDGLATTINQLDEENKKLKDVIAANKWDATEIEQEDILETVKSLREQIRVLEIDNKSLRESRDMYQQRNVELQKVVKGLQKNMK